MAGLRAMAGGAGLQPAMAGGAGLHGSHRAESADYQKHSEGPRKVNAPARASLKLGADASVEVQVGDGAQEGLLPAVPQVRDHLGHVLRLCRPVLNRESGAEEGVEWLAVQCTSHVEEVVVRVGRVERFGVGHVPLGARGRQRRLGRLAHHHPRV